MNFVNSITIFAKSHSCLSTRTNSFAIMHRIVCHLLPNKMDDFLNRHEQFKRNHHITVTQTKSIRRIIAMEQITSIFFVAWRLCYEMLGLRLTPILRGKLANMICNGKRIRFEDIAVNVGARNTIILSNIINAKVFICVYVCYSVTRALLKL